MDPEDALNDWLAIAQFTVIENGNNRRPDVVVFLNGLPVGVIEVKKPGAETATLGAAFNQLQTYKAQIPSLFRANAVLVTTDDDPAAAGAIADRLAAACWERRALFEPDLTPVDEAVRLAMSAERWPVILADVADNPGGGASGDGTAILAALLAARADGAVVATIADPEAVRAAEAIGAGNRGRLQLGGKTDHLHGPTLELDVRVRWAGDLSFVNRGPMGTGMTTRLGSSAVVEAGDPPVEVIVATNRVQALDPELLRVAGIEPESRRIIVLKSSVHFRAAFESLAAGIIEVDGPGLSSPDLLSLPYRRVRRPIWPLDRDMR